MRSVRLMTSIFLVREERLLLLYRRGSRVIEDSWVGIGGHLEPGEARDPATAALRELEEEVGLGADDVDDLSLRYVALRDVGGELRCTYYFTADLRAGVPEPRECTEGELRWFPLPMDPDDLAMPPTAKVALQHWLAEGRQDPGSVWAIVMADEGARILPLATT